MACQKENMTEADPFSSLSGESYYVADRLGEGAYGAVRIVYSSSGRTFAAKEFNAEEEEEEEYDSDEEVEAKAPGLDLGILREISSLYLCHEKKSTQEGCEAVEYIMRIEDIAPVTGARGMCMIMPKLSCDLESVVKSKCLKNSQKLSIAHKLVCAMAFLHRNDIIHRDIKPANVLLDESMDTPIIADFSCAKIFDQKLDGTTHTPGLGTCAYIAPEVAAEEGYGFPSDVYSLGVVLLELFNGQLPVDRTKASLSYVADMRTKMGGQPLPTLLKGMLDPDPETRLTFAQVLDLDVFKKFKKPVFSRVHKKMVRSPELDEAATKQKGKKRKSKGRVGLMKSLPIDKAIDRLYSHLEFENPLTKMAARIYHEKTAVRVEYCTLIASKMYETELITTTTAEEVVSEYDAEEFAAAEQQIFRAMGYCLYV